MRECPHLADAGLRLDLAQSFQLVRLLQPLPEQAHLGVPVRLLRRARAREAHLPRPRPPAEKPTPRDAAAPAGFIGPPRLRAREGGQADALVRHAAHAVIRGLEHEMEREMHAVCGAGQASRRQAQSGRGSRARARAGGRGRARPWAGARHGGRPPSCTTEGRGAGRGGRGAPQWRTAGTAACSAGQGAWIGTFRQTLPPVPAQDARLEVRCRVLDGALPRKSAPGFGRTCQAPGAPPRLRDGASSVRQWRGGLNRRRSRRDSSSVLVKRIMH